MSGPASIERSPEMPAHVARLFAIVERDARRAVGVAIRWHARSADLPPRVQALVAYCLGYAWLRWERLDAAEALLSDARRQFEDLGQPRLALHVQRAQLYLVMLRGGSAGHAAEWEKLAFTYEQQGDQLSAARARLGEMVQLNLQGRAHDALSLSTRVAPVLERDGAPGDRAWLWRLIGVAHVNRAAFAEALRCLDQAAALFANLGQRAELAKTWMEYSNLYEHRSDPAQASSYIERAYPAVLKLDLPLRAAFCIKNLGWFAALQGEYDRGIQLSLHAYDQLIALNRTDYVAGCDLNLGNIACYAGLWDLAVLAYRRAERIYADLGHRRMSLICRRNQAQTLRLSGQPRAALQLIQALIVVAEQCDDRLEVAELLLAQGQALADLDETAAAARELARAEAQCRELGNDTAAGESALDQGWLLLRQHMIAPAEECLHRARILLQEQPIYQWRADHGLGRCAERSGDLPGALTRYRSACEMVAGLRRRLANEHASSGLFAQARQLVDDAIRLAWQMGDPETMLDLAELQRSLALTAKVREEQTQVLFQGMPDRAGAHIRSSEPSPAGGLDPTHQQDLQAYLERRLRRRHTLPAADSEPPARLDLVQLRMAFQRAFPAGWALLTYLPCADQLLICIVTPDGIEVVASMLDMEFQQLLARATTPAYRSMTYLFEGSGQEAGASDWPTLTALGDRLLPAQIHERLSPGCRLLIMASGALHSMPWAALRVRGRWLIEQATPHLLPGLQIWQDLTRRRSQSTDALLVGVSRFGTRAQDLAGVTGMLDAAQARWPGRVTRLDEAQASAKTLLDRAERDELRQYGLLHFATHGQLVAASGLYTHLKLADGDLFYDDVMRLGLSGALVVLATCDGAAVEVLPGEEVLSLSRAFLAAGARDVIASAWQLYDATAPQFFAVLYAQLSASADVPSALATAQRTWLSHKSGDKERDTLFSTPLIWAGLSALGAGTTHEVEKC